MIVPLTMPAPVKAGVQYAVVLTANTRCYEIANGGNTYPGGEAVYRMLLDGAGPFWFS